MAETTGHLNKSLITDTKKVYTNYKKNKTHQPTTLRHIYTNISVTFSSIM